MEGRGTHVSRSLTAVLLVATLGLPSTSAAATIRQQSEETYDAAGVTALRVENSRGLIRVGTSSDGRIHLTAIKESKGASRAQAERIAARTRVIARVRNGVLDVEVAYPPGERHTVDLWKVMWGGFEFPRHQVRLGLDVPASLPVALETTSGDIYTRGLGGRQSLKTTSGDVSVEDAAGRIEASSTSGDIEAAGAASARLSSVSGDILATGVRGPLYVRTTSGDLTVRDTADSLVIDSVSGDVAVTRAPHGVRASATSGEIVVRDASGIVRLETSSGDVGVRVVGPVRRLDVSTTSGDITTRYLASAGCALDLTTASGSIDVSLPVELRTATRRALRGRVGDGAVPITLTTASGDIDVRGPRN
jgi:hypothetical protein